MNELKVFKNEEFGEVRSLVIDNEPWFVASDVCKALDLTNATMAISRLDEDEKSKLNLGLSGGATNCVNEYGLYNLVLASRKKEAKKFKRWITHEVLPTIRKTGGYQIPRTNREYIQLLMNANEETNQRIDVIEKDVTDLKENKLLNPGEYNFLSKAVRKRVRTVKEVRNLDLTKEQNSKIYSAINRDLNNYIGVKTRSQFKEKDFDKALEFVNGWEPSYTDMKMINQLSINI